MPTKIKVYFFTAVGFGCLLVDNYIGHEIGHEAALSIAGALRVGNQEQTFYAAASVVYLNPFIHPPELTDGHTDKR